MKTENLPRELIEKYKVKFIFQQVKGIIVATIFTIPLSFGVMWIAWTPIIVATGEAPPSIPMSKLPIAFLGVLIFFIMMWMLCVLTQIKLVFWRYVTDWEYKRTGKYIVYYK